VGSIALAIVLLAIGAYGGDDDNATRYFLMQLRSERQIDPRHLA
jgi:hypothetical protein